MKTQLFAFAAVAVIFAGCAKVGLTENPAAESQSVSDIVVSMPVQTKTAFGEESDGTMNVVWTEGDRIKVIDASSEPAKEGIYILENGIGDGIGTFAWSEGEVIGNVTDIIYPASAAEDLSIPENQTYNEDSYDPEAAVLKYHSEEPVAISESFTLENTASIICIRLRGNETVASVSAALTPANGGETHVYTLSSEEGVSLSADAIPFYIAVPGSDTEYELAVTVNSSNGSEPLTQETSEPRAFAASSLVRFPVLDYSVAAGKTYAIGDYWPDEENAEGIVFSISDGGLHGKVISIYEKNAKWGPQISEAQAGVAGMREEPEDGKLITKSLIEKYKDTDTFATDYPCFEWIYSTMNKGEVDGPWYAPVRQEVAEWAVVMSGFDWDEVNASWKTDTGGPGYCQDKLPISNWTDQTAQDARKAFNEKVKAAGGNEINLWGKYCSTWENQAGTSVFRFNITTNSDEGGQYQVIPKTESSNRIRPVRTF